MASDWKPSSLREAGVTLIDCDHRTPPAADSGYPYIAIPQLKEGRISLGDVRRISFEHFVEWTRKAKPQHHDVVLSRRCNPGETAYVPQGLECALGQNLVLLRADGTKLFPPFLRWLVRGPAWWEQVGTFINVGAVFDSLKCADIPNFKMPLPPLTEQKAIARVLGALDDKIELNQRVNATLEQIARTLFQSWFVDFDPVRAKLDGRPAAALDPATAAAFPEHLEDSPLGKKPIGWDVTALENVLSVLETGGRPKGGVGGITSGVPSIGAESIVGVGLFDYGKTKFVPVEFYEGMKKGRIESHDVLLYKDGGRPGEYEPHVSMFGCGFPFEKCSINEHVYRLRANERLSQEYLYFWMTSEFALAEMRIKGTGVAIPGLNSSAVRSLGVLVPPRPIVDAFTRQVAPLITRLLINAKQSRTLAMLRDALLPKLLNGDISIPL